MHKEEDLPLNQGPKAFYLTEHECNLILGSLVENHPPIPIQPAHLEQWLSLINRLQAMRLQYQAGAQAWPIPS